jgi:pentatricopeptide repeat protein
MEEEFGIRPGIRHYGCMVDVLGRAGLLLEAEEMIGGMTGTADTVIWGAAITMGMLRSLSGQCGRCKNLILATMECTWYCRTCTRRPEDGRTWTT